MHFGGAVPQVCDANAALALCFGILVPGRHSLADRRDAIRPHPPPPAAPLLTPQIVVTRRPSTAEDGPPTLDWVVANNLLPLRSLDHRAHPFRPCPGVRPTGDVAGR